MSSNYLHKAGGDGSFAEVAQAADYSLWEKHRVVGKGAEGGSEPQLCYILEVQVSHVASLSPTFLTY